MKKFFAILLTSVLTILTLGIALSKETEAAQFMFDKGTIQDSDIIYDNLYIFNNNVNVKGIIRGDLVIFGNDIVVSASITGNAYIFGNSVEVEDSTRIDGNLVLFGNNTSIKGIIGGNTTVFANTNRNTSSTAKDFLIFASSSILTGNVGDDARIFAATSNIDSNISGDLIIMAEKSEINETKIGKKIYTSETIKKIAKDQGVELDKESKGEGKFGKLGGLWTRFSSVLIRFVGMFAAGALLIFMGPVKSLDITKKITGSLKDFLTSLGVGIGILFFGWLPILFLFISLAGALLGMLLTGFILFGIIFGIVWINLAIGREILKLVNSKERNPYLALLVGGAASAIIWMIPILSGIYSFIAVCTAIGAMTRMKWDKFKTK